MKRFITSLCLLLFAALPAFAQSSPGLITGQVPTAGQWNSYFAAKQDMLGYTPVNKAGDVMTGKLITVASTTIQAGLSIPAGAAPTSPINGDIWTTTAGVFARINGVTVGPLTGPVSTSFAGTSPIGVTFPAGVVTYAFDFTIANTFLAQQTAQGATTTSPGWYAQIAGDTVPRVRIGMNATDFPSIAFGAGNAVRDTFLERIGPGSLRYGGPDAAAPVAQSISVQNVLAGTSNTAGAIFTISGSQGTGTGIGGSIIFQVAAAGGSGSTQNALAIALTIDSTKKATFTGAIQATAAALGGATIGGNAFAVTGTSLFNSAVTMSAALTYGGVTLTNAVTGTGSMVLSSGSSIASLTVTGALTATGLITLADHATQGANTFLANVTAGTASPTAATLPSCTGSANALQYTNGTGLSCATITAAAASIAVGTTTVSGSATNRILFNNAGTLGDITAVNNAVLATNGSGVPSEVTTLPSGLTAPALVITTSLTYGGVTLSNSVSGTGSMALNSNTTFTGVTQTATLNVSSALQVGACSASSIICANGITTSAGTNPLCWNSGTFQITSSTACTASDERLKSNFGSAPGLAAIECLNGISFDWLDAEQARRGGRQIGFTAQAVQRCIPELVTDNGQSEITLQDGSKRIIEHTLAVDYAKLTAVLVNAIKEMRK